MHPTIRRAIAPLALALSLLAFGGGLPWPAPAASAQAIPAQQDETWSTLEDDWMILEIAGGRVGWMNNIVEQAGERIRSRSITQMSIGRGDQNVAIKMETAFIETADGKPISVSSIQNMAKQAMETNWTFDGDKIKQVSKQGGRETTSELAAPKVEWLPPHKADLFSRQQRESGAKDFTFRTIDPQNGVKPISSTSKRAGETEYEVNGKKIPVEIWKTTTDIMPIEATEYYDAEGDLVYQEIPTGMGKIVMRTASKEQALEKLEAGGPEVLGGTFITPSKPIEHSMKAAKAKLKLTARSGTLPDMPSAGAQRVEMSADRKTAILTIDIDDNLAAGEAEKSNDEFTKPSAMLDYDDALVSKLAGRAADEKDAFKKAEALRKIVYKHISKKNMATAFASASETARTRTGDCSEHGVLLAALLRAQGIPSRVGMGLVYAESFMGQKGIFGWHMWSQALIDGKWVDFDATLPVRYNAAHILTNVSSLADGMGAADMGSIMTLIGNIDVEVLDVGYAE